MAERTKGILATVTVVACLGLLGFMLWIKAEGAAVAAAAAVTTLVAWLTRAPDKKDPPAGASLVPIAAIGLALAAELLGCASSQAGKEREAEALYMTEHMRCVDVSDTRGEMNACRERVRERWNRDAGFTVNVAKDGGR